MSTLQPSKEQSGAMHAFTALCTICSAQTCRVRFPCEPNALQPRPNHDKNTLFEIRFRQRTTTRWQEQAKPTQLDWENTSKIGPASWHITSLPVVVEQALFSRSEEKDSLSAGSRPMPLFHEQKQCCMREKCAGTGSRRCISSIAKFSTPCATELHAGAETHN